MRIAIVVAMAIAGAIAGAGASVGCAPAPVPSQPVQTGSPEISQHAETRAIDRMLSEHVGGWDAHRVWIVDYRQQGRHVEIVGEAVGAEDVSRFARRVSVDRTFADVSIGASAMAEGGVIRFAMTMTSTLDAPTSYAIHSWPKLPPVQPPAAASPAADEPRAAMAEGVPIDQIKLTGIVTAERPKAMLTLPDGKAIIVKAGDVVSERWQVLRVEEREVVLFRDGIERRLRL